MEECHLQFVKDNFSRIFSCSNFKKIELFFSRVSEWSIIINIDLALLPFLIIFHLKIIFLIEIGKKNRLFTYNAGMFFIHS